MLGHLITRVSATRGMVVKVAGSLMLFLMVKVKRSSSRRIMVGKFKFGEVLLPISSVLNVGFLVIVLQSVLH